ncbi:GspH/FimT family pseudopilin [Pseudomonas knackmussii]|uniref:Type II secretion system protein H n=1 Tax=Pseudomonas knackmussii TaxID=65741 RepID=A0ABY4KRG5_9PSED|nr:GspH/FimT family pseudopilin [Pseudomonas knackmussii]UPQ83461.1 GspH/FimT family pseudopilin [Pseudomonas knackmussii]
MKRHSGFTLIELMITLAVLAIVLGIAMPAISDFAIKQRVSSKTNEMMLSLAFARSEALKLNRDVRVMPSTGSAAGWSDGWCVGPATINNCNHAEVVRVFSPANGVSITSSGIANPPILVFRRDGTTPQGNAALAITSPNLNATGSSARCITLNPQGRAEVRKVTRDNGC